MTDAAHIQAVILACWTPADPLLRQFETDPALMHLGDKPVLQRVLEKLVGMGCRRIAIVHGDRPRQAEALLGDGERWGCEITHQYAAAGDKPLQLLERLAPRGAAGCVLAPADTLALADFDMGEQSVACTLEAGALRWSGWAVLAGDALRSLAVSASDANDLAAQVMASLRATGRAPLITATLSTASAAAALASLPRLFHLSPSPTGISRRPWLEDIWIGNGSRVHPSARLHAPVYIGSNVLVGENAEIGPDTAIGDGCIIDARSRIERSMLLPDSYVGRKLELADALVGGNRLINARLGVALHIPDPGFLREVYRGDRVELRASLTQRVLAAALWMALSPAAAILRGRLYRARERAPAAIGVPAPVAGTHRSVPVRFALSHEDVYAGVQGAWTGHFFATFLPGLRDAAAGAVALVGPQPRSAEEIDSLPYYWQRLYRLAPSGLLGEALLQGREGAAAEMRYASDALGTVPMSLAQVLRMLWRYGARVASEISGRRTIRPAPTGDTRSPTAV